MPDGFERNRRLGRGINLGNMLEAPRDRSWGEILELKLDYFPIIRARGFDSVRLPTRWSDYAAPEAPYIIDADFFQRVDGILDAALSAGLAVVLNAHHYEEIFHEPQQHEARLLAIWDQIARRYQSYSPDLIFEILNEPHGALTNEVWNSMAARAVSVIRASNPQRTIMVGPGDWNAIRGLDGFVPPADPNLILTVHYYLPMAFTHQGAHWVAGSDAWLNTPWLGTPEERAAVQADFQSAEAFASRHHLPVYLGEFGAYDRADLESRVRWTDWITRQAEALGWSWAYWEFCASFGAYDPLQQAWREPLARALLAE